MLANLLTIQLLSFFFFSSDTILNPQFTDEEIEECKEIVRLQQNELPAEMLSRDAVQIAAYRGGPYGM